MFDSLSAIYQTLFIVSCIWAAFMVVFTLTATKDLWKIFLSFTAEGEEKAEYHEAWLENHFPMEVVTGLFCFVNFWFCGIFTVQTFGYYLKWELGVIFTLALVLMTSFAFIIFPSIIFKWYRNAEKLGSLFRNGGWIGKIFQEIILFCQLAFFIFTLAVFFG